MKSKLLLFIAVILSSALFSQTNVPEGPVSGIWTVAGSPYLIQGETSILNNTILTIEPGVLVQWQGSYAMWVYGKILAQGTQTDTIAFTASNPEQGFQGIRFWDTPQENDTSRFEYCIFEHGKVYKPSPNNSGGAIAVTNFDKIIIDHCLFTHNTAIVFNVMNPGGGAIALSNSSPSITNCKFDDNLAMSAGAILCYDNSHPLIENNLFVNNTADGEDQYGQGYGGAISCWIDCDPIILNNTFHKNYAETGGGAVAFVSRCEPLIIQNLFTDNTCDWIGGAIELQDTCYAQIINNTIVDNIGEFGGGIHFWDDNIADIINTIIWGNHANDGSAGQLYAESGSSCILNLNYSDLQGGWDGIGGVVTGIYEDCMEDDPNLVGSGDHPYQINDNSPCIDIGDPDSEDYNLPEEDLACEERIFNDIIDIGAYEWNPLVGIEVSEVKSLRAVLQCYPNPFSVVTSIEFELSQTEAIQLNIYNQVGELVKVIKMYAKGGKQIITWDASDLPSGIYYIQLHSKHETMMQKIIKM